MKIARVFPRQTKASPTDELCFFDAPGLFPPEIDEVHVSCTFSWDKPKAENLAKQWEQVAPVKIGGVAYNDRGGDFVAGRYLKPGYVITSRGCPNRCWFCSVWRREGNVIRELPIVEGWNLLDDNLLACSDNHIKNVFAMLEKQRGVEFTGGLEAARLKPWHIDLLTKLKIKQMFLAYDTPDDYEPLVTAAKMLHEGGLLRSHKVRAYVLIGFGKDTFQYAEKRLTDVCRLGIMPMAMLYRGEADCAYDPDWKRFQRTWANPWIVGTKMKAVLSENGNKTITDVETDSRKIQIFTGIPACTIVHSEFAVVKPWMLPPPAQNGTAGTSLYY